MFFFEKRITKDSNHLLIIKKRIGHQSMKTDNRFYFFISKYFVRINVYFTLVRLRRR